MVNSKGSQWNGGPGNAPPHGSGIVLHGPFCACGWCLAGQRKP